MNVNGRRPSMLVILSHLFVLYRQNMMMCGFVRIFFSPLCFLVCIEFACIIIKNVLFIDSNKYLHTPNESNYGYFRPRSPVTAIHMRTNSICIQFFFVVGLLLCVKIVFQLFSTAPTNVNETHICIHFHSSKQPQTHKFIRIREQKKRIMRLKQTK